MRNAERLKGGAPLIDLASRENACIYEKSRQDRQSLQTDPVGYEDDLNLYQYVGNDPLNQTDPTGRCPACQQLTDLFLGVVHGSGQTGFVGVSNDVAVGTGYTMAGGAYFQKADSTSMHTGLYGNFGPAAGLALSVQAEVGILEGDRSNLVGGAVEGAAGLGAVSITRGQTLGPDGGVPYTAVAVGPSARLPVTNAPLPGPVSGRGAAPMGGAVDVGRVQLSPTALSVSNAARAVIDFLNPPQKTIEERK